MPRASRLHLAAPDARRFDLSLTRFIQLTSPAVGETRLPPTILVLHAKHGNCIGPLAAYNVHVLGGPHSCRGFSLAELGPARCYLESAIELRVPVPIANTHAYAFVDHARDLGAADEVVGNPREAYGKLGRGTGAGVGVRLGALRLELVRDGNTGRANGYVQFGERF